MKPTKCQICNMPIREGNICYDCELKEKQRREQHKLLFGMAVQKIREKNIESKIDTSVTTTR